MARTGRVAVGFCGHAGWAAAVTLAGAAGAPQVVDRRRIVLVDGGTEAAQIYHAAADMPAREGAALVARVTREAAARARAELAELAGDLKQAGHPLAAACVSTGRARIPDSLAAILASHALIHAAEGELYRRLLAEAAAHCRLAVLRPPTKELAATLGGALAIPGDTLRKRLADAGRGLGPPWGADQKEAMAAAWLALASAPA